MKQSRESIFDAINAEREYQNKKWGEEFNSKNTLNDWVAYIASYTGKAVTLPFDANTYRTSLLKVAALCVAALERGDEFVPRHYDKF